MRHLLLAFLFSFAVFAQDKQITGTRVANTLNAVITNLTLPNLPITNMLRLTAQGSVTNVQIGTGISFDGTTISANGSIVGAGGGNTQSAGTTTATNIPYYLDGTGTNIGPSTAIFLQSGTNFVVPNGNIFSKTFSLGTITSSGKYLTIYDSTLGNGIRMGASAGLDYDIYRSSSGDFRSAGNEATFSAFSWHTTSQTNALWVANNGNVGMGVSAPSDNLEIARIGGSGIRLTRPTASATSVDLLGKIDFYNGITRAAQIQGVSDGATDSGRLDISTTTGGILTRQMIISSSGALQLTVPLQISFGGHGAATKAAGFNALSPTTTKGDLISRDGSNNTRLPVGTDGQVLIADAASTTGLKWTNQTSGSSGGTAGTVINTGTPAQFSIPYYSDTTGTNVAPIASPLSGTIPVVWVLTNNSLTIQFKKLPMVDEMTAGNQNGGMGWTADSLGTGGNASTGDAQDFGVLNCSTGSATNGAAAWNTRGSSGFFDTPTMTVRMRVKTPATLSTDTDVYRIYCGFGDGTTAEPVDGAYFQYSHGTASGNWSAKTSSATAKTVITTTGSAAVTADAWWELMVSGNSTVVNFWVSSNDGATWTHIGYSAANIPKTSGEVFGIFFRIIKEAGVVGTANKIFSCGRTTFWPN